MEYVRYVLAKSSTVSNFATDRWKELCQWNLNKILLELLGLWPYDTKIKKRCRYAAFAIWMMMTSAMAIEGLIEVTVWDTIMFYGTVGVIMWILSSFFLATALYMEESSLRELNDHLESNLKALINAEEIAIMQTFAQQATSMTAIFTGCSIIAAIVFLIGSFLPMAYKNADEYSKMFSTYSKRWIIVDSLYKFQIIGHFVLTACYMALLFIAVLHVYMYSVKHTCGMFAIVSYRLRNLGYRSNINLEVDDTMRLNEQVISDLTDIIVKHKEAMKSCQIVGSKFNTLFYILQVVGLSYASVFMFGIQLGYDFKSIHLIAKVIALVAIIMLYAFYLNYGGQLIIESSNKVFMDACYSTFWESMSTKPKKMVLMLMLRSSHDCTFKAGLMTLSLENFVRLLHLGWSLATVLSSVQKKVHVLK